MLPVHGNQAADASLVHNFERRFANIVLPGRPVRGTEAGDMSAFAVTLFETFAAQTKRDESLSLDALADRVRTVTAATKEALPLLKLARFGNARSAKGSLRHDRNVIAVSGLEADYDGERIGFEEALSVIERAGIEAIVYTSPSYTDERPRWRVVCPFSTELPPDRRHHMMGRLNGLFGGIFAAESWTLSQAYYFGLVNSNPAHRVEIIEGTPIDKLDELDEIWLGKPVSIDKRLNGNGDFRSGPVDEAALLEAIISSESYHQCCVRLVGKWAQQGVPFLDAQKQLFDAFDEVEPFGRDARWQARRDDVPRIVRDIYGAEAKQRDAATGESDDAIPPDFSDEALALEFANRHGSELCYVATLGKWHIWNGTHWRPDDTLQVLALARAVCRGASALVPPKRGRLAFAVASARTTAAVERLARADSRHATAADPWDRDSWIFNTPIERSKPCDCRPQDR